MMIRRERKKEKEKDGERKGERECVKEKERKKVGVKRKPEKERASRVWFVVDKRNLLDYKSFGDHIVV